MLRNLKNNWRKQRYKVLFYFLNNFKLILIMSTAIGHKVCKTRTFLEPLL